MLRSCSETLGLTCGAMCEVRSDRCSDVDSALSPPTDPPPPPWRARVSGLAMRCLATGPAHRRATSATSAICNGTLLRSRWCSCHRSYSEVRMPHTIVCSLATTPGAQGNSHPQMVWMISARFTGHRRRRRLVRVVGGGRGGYVLYGWGTRPCCVLCPWRERSVRNECESKALRRILFGPCGHQLQAVANGARKLGRDHNVGRPQ